MTTTNTGYTRHGPKADEAAERLIRNEVLACQSMLVDAHLAATQRGKMPGDISTHWEWDDVENLYPDPSDWSPQKCWDWLREHVTKPPEIEKGTGENHEHWELRLRDAVRDHAEPAEVYEWWLITEWLAEQLRELGEPILETDYGTWWGRTCTGQGILGDGTFQEIAHKLDMDR